MGKVSPELVRNKSQKYIETSFQFNKHLKTTCKKRKKEREKNKEPTAP